MQGLLCFCSINCEIWEVFHRSAPALVGTHRKFCWKIFFHLKHPSLLTISWSFALCQSSPPLFSWNPWFVEQSSSRNPVVISRSLALLEMLPISLKQPFHCCAKQCTLPPLLCYWFCFSLHTVFRIFLQSKGSTPFFQKSKGCMVQSKFRKDRKFREDRKSKKQSSKKSLHTVLRIFLQSKGSIPFFQKSKGCKVRSNGLRRFRSLRSLRDLRSKAIGFF